jgi:hypothetical protein
MNRLGGLGRLPGPRAGHAPGARGRSWRVRVAAATVGLAAAVTGGLVVTGSPAAAAVGGAVPQLVAPGLLRSVVTDPNTGQQIVADVTVGAVTAGAAGLGAAGIGGAGQPGFGTASSVLCRWVTGEYQIYFLHPRVDLLRWKFTHQWCWQDRRLASSPDAVIDAVSDVVVTATASNSRIYKHTMVKQVGSWQRTVGPLGRSSVRVTHQGMHFEVCPLSSYCVGNFDPIIDFYLAAGGAAYNFSNV